MNEITLYESQSPTIGHCGTGYKITTPSGTRALKRDVDFGVIPKTKQPTLFKSGAEKIALAFGLFQRYEIESKVEKCDSDDPFFHYTVRCDLVKLNPLDGKEVVFVSGFGSANTKEKRNGFNDAYNSANSTLKMAQKRALVSAAIAIGGLSDMFTQDMENETFMSKAKDLVDSADPESPISANQIKRLYAIAGQYGISANEAKNKIIAMGYESTKAIKQKDYDKICELFIKEDK